eukprot:TRINITY_DN9758_c0_g1_i6.p2 TRINITY_DN9758_c0_g1~~TRINITY_DN9758_c0_g1_i6.p2  ORF type:complete len:189 (-),score=52.83 TRINITY_DN9758_c0_g1_i6:176-742(-)
MNQAFALLLSVLSVAHASWLAEFTVNLAPGQIDKFVMEVHPEWAPLGAARFEELIDSNFFKGARFFRVIDGFMAQFGIHGNPKIAAEWKTKTMKDDPVKESNKRGFVSFATSGKDSRTTQMFINFSDNANLDSMDFSPFAQIVKGMESTVDNLHKGYGEGAPSGKGPEQGRIQSEGNKYLKRLSLIHI